LALWSDGFAYLSTALRTALVARCRPSFRQVGVLLAYVSAV
jgi:hypothetical protein